jgi:mannose-6-phosphate isomerase-like protein (cupin superfamily)
MIVLNAKKLLQLTAFALIFTASARSQSNHNQTRKPSAPARPFVVIRAQSLSALEQTLRTSNRTKELFGGPGLQLRIAIEHEKDRAPVAAESHDAVDDVYYILEGSAILTLGGRLESPREIAPGEWLGKGIIGGQTFEVSKGDLIVVPRGTPHQRSTVGRSFSMLLIKISGTPMVN